MDDKTNVSQLFKIKGEEKKHKNNETTEYIDATSGRVHGTVLNQNLSYPTIHLSFTIDNVIGALACNKFKNENSVDREEFLQDTNHNWEKTMTVLFEYIIGSLNVKLNAQGQVAEGGGDKLNDILVFDSQKKYLLTQLSVELKVLDDYSVAILFYEGDILKYGIAENAIDDID